MIAELTIGEILGISCFVGSCASLLYLFFAGLREDEDDD